jgi:hypothetical protein
MAEIIGSETITIPEGVINYGTLGRDANPKNALIKRVANGFILEIGCKTFVAKNWLEASKGLGEYWKNPKAAEKKYCAE